jgi:hypothetical protein
VSATSPHPVQPRNPTRRAALLLAAAGIVVAGCAPASEPVANRTAAPHAGAAAPAIPSGDNRPGLAGVPQTPATTSTVPGARTSPGGTPAATAPPVAEVTLADLLVNVDEALADLDAQLTSAARDADTPEGDLG